MPRPHTVAVVDDDSRVVESLQNLLESAGYTAHGFTSADQLIAHPLWATFDLLIADIGMPGTDGFALARRVQAERPGTPVLLITGGERPLREAEAIAAPVLFKPIDADRLLAEIAEKLAQS